MRGERSKDQLSSINKAMNEFRVASRELFNNHFHRYDPYENDGWSAEERFREVQVVLFRELVTKSVSLPNIRYGQVQSAIQVKPRNQDEVPVMLNRHLDSGYWDYPITILPIDTTMQFICFFDWDQLDWRDNRYVRAFVKECPIHRDIEGKHALIESQYVEFIL